MHGLAHKYQWADEDYNLAWTVAAIQGKTADGIVGIYGGNPGQKQLLTFEEARPPEDEFGQYFQLQVRTQGTYVVAVENNGWSGNVPEIARRASAGDGSFFSAYWNVEGRWHIAEARNGNVTAYFDVAMRYPTDKLPAWLDGVDLSADNLGSTCLALMEQQTGLAFDRAWLTEPWPTYRIPDPDQMLADTTGAREP